MIGIPAYPTRVALGRRLRALANGIAVLLVVFHAWLLVERLRDASIADPAVVLRWALAGLLVGSALVLRRQGIPIFTGRTGLALWLLVLLLHVGPVPVAGGAVAPPQLAAAMPLAVAAMLAAALAAASPTRRVAPDAPASPGPRARGEEPRARRAGSPLALRCVPRPPPVPSFG